MIDIFEDEKNRIASKYIHNPDICQNITELKNFFGLSSEKKFLTKDNLMSFLKKKDLSISDYLLRYQ